MDNYEDFYCGECKYYAELYDRRKDDIKEWCNMHNHKVEFDDKGSPGFKLIWEGEDE